MTLENKLEYDLPCWNSISENCRDLITKLLLKDPMHRITLDDVLKHKWFNGIDLNKETGLVQNKNASQNFKNKIEALRAESDLYECNEFEVAVLTGAPLWRLRDFRSAKNNYYPFVKLPKPKSDETRKVKRDVRKVVYPLGRLRAALNSI